MKAQHWIFSVRYYSEDGRGFGRRAVVGSARASTVEAALQLADVPEVVRSEIRAHQTVQAFVEGTLDPESTGYYVSKMSASLSSSSWHVCIGSVDDVLLGEAS